MAARAHRAVAALLLLGAGGCAAVPGAGGGWTRTWNPAGDVYPVYLADPTRSRFGAQVAESLDPDLAQAGDSLFVLEMGGRFDLVRFERDGGEGAVQVDLEAGFRGEFDRDDSLDNLGWDGMYAAHVAWRAGARTALRVGLEHLSSHLGDEYAAETGRTRVNYTREEVLFGASWWPRDPFRVYGELAYAYHVGDGALERGRAQAGAEWTSAPLLAGAPGWYAAADVSGFEEDDWGPNVAVEGGWAVPVPDGRGTWRFGLRAYDGRRPIGELFDSDETRLALGAWYDL